MNTTAKAVSVTIDGVIGAQGYEIVYFGLPVWALGHAYTNDLTAALLLRIVLAIGCSLSGLALLQMFATELVYSAKILKQLWY
jgi:hypothetical protein